MNKHTPGPWIARKTGGAGWPGQRGWAIDYNEDQEQVTDFVYEEADDRLIAAAPDLLEALERLQCAAYNIGGEHVTDHQQLIDAADFAQSIIARARGEA